MSLTRVCGNVLSGVGEVSLAKIMMVVDVVKGTQPLMDDTILDVLKSA